jgi:hypothetical protein
MNYSFTIFKSIFDNKTHRRMDFSSWGEFEKLLYKLSAQPGYKPKKDERRLGSPLISPAIFEANTTRKNDNVKSWGGWAALDVDDYECDWQEACNIFMPYKHVRYSSASSTIIKPKFRVVLPLTRTVNADEIRHLWYALNKEFNSLGDPQTKDLSRMYYVPADYPDSFHFIESNDGAFIDPSELMSKHAFVREARSTFMESLPEAMRERIIEYRKESLNNRNYKWSGYRDCPFVNKDLVSKYFTLQGTGWYRQMYSIMVSIAGKAVRCGYPITPSEIANICREIDTESGGWYKNRNLETESLRAIEFAVGNM